MTFEGTEPYPGAIDKAAAILESVVKNHPFVDGNKRAGYTLVRLTLGPMIWTCVQRMTRNTTGSFK